MGYARCDVKPNVDGIKKLPASWTVPVDISEGRTVTFAFNYVWTQNNCAISNIEWYPTQLVNGEWTSQNIAFDTTANIDFFNQSNKITIKFGGSSATVSSNATLNSGSATGLTVSNISASYLSASFKYSYIVKYDDTTEKWVAAGSNDEPGEYSFIEYFIKIDNIRIAKISKYENNVVFTERGVNELLTNIKKYPITDVTSVESNATDAASHNIWNYYTGGKPCVKIDYGDRSRTFGGYTTNGAQTTGYKYVAVGSNIKFQDPNNNNAEITTAASDPQKTGTFRVNIDGVTYEVPVKGFSADGLTLSITHINTYDNSTHEAGPSGSTIAGDTGYFNNLYVNGNSIDTTNLNEAINGSTDTTKVFWRGDANWSNTLEGSFTLAANKSAYLKIGAYGGNYGTSGTADLWYNASSSDVTPSGSTTTYKATTLYCNKNFGASKVYNAVFNDYAECRTTINLAPGHVVIDQDDGSLACSSKRLQPGAQVISDTFGHLMGETDMAKTPLAVAGRVLVYTYQPRENYHAGMAVCSAPDGTVDIMSRAEICEYPDCIVGIVSEIPNYDTWGSDNVKVDGRIWIKVK